MSASLPSQIQIELGKLGPEAQRQVLEYVRSLKQRRTGMSGVELKKFAGTLSVTDAESMIDAIEAGCEQVNLDEW